MTDCSIYSPIPGTYAVIQTDVDATLRAAENPIPSSTVAGLKPVRCLVYLCSSLQLPFPNKEWCRYKVYLVGPGLRPADPTACLTADMSVPLAPCDKHPDGRSPLKPKLPFPFANCYHWIGPDMVRTVRVKTRAYTEYDEGKAILLPGIDHVELEEFFHDDLVRCARAMQAEAPGDTTQLQHEAHEETSPEPDGKPGAGFDDAPRALVSKPSTPCHRSDQESDGEVPYEPNEQSFAAWGSVDYDDYESTYSEGRSVADFDTINESAVDAVPAVAIGDFFGLGDIPGNDLLPIVDAWLDIGSALEEEDIPDPMEFIRGCEALVQLIQASKSSVPAPEPPPLGGDPAPCTSRVGQQKGKAGQGFIGWSRIRRWVRSVLHLK